jgi:ribosomal protein S20
MPIIKSAIKRMKQTTVRRARNVETKKNMKAAVRAFTDKPSFAALSEAQSAIDTAVKKNVLNKGTAARRKSALVKVAKEAGVKVEASSKKKVVGSKKKAPAAKAVAAKKPAAVKKPVAAKKPATKTATKKPAAKKPAAKK